MKQKTVFIAGLIGLIFGFLFAGTLGISFFDENPVQDNVDDMTDATMLIKDSSKFAEAYNLDNSIYSPITGDEAESMIDGDGTFIIYAGRDTCPYCQQFVPVLMETSESLGVETIYHIDTLDPLNQTFVNDQNVTVTPTTFVFQGGELVRVVIGYYNLEDIEAILDDYFG